MTSKAPAPKPSAVRSTSGAGRAPAPPAPTDSGPLAVGRHSHGPVALGFLYAVGALVAFFLAQQLLRVGSVVILVVVSLFIAVGLDPSVRWLQRKGLTRPLAVLAVITTVVVALVLFFVALVPVISDQVKTIVDNAPGWLQESQRNQQVQELDDRFHIIAKV